MSTTANWFSVTRIADDTHQITEFEPVLQVNTFIIDGGDEALLIDTGVGVGDLRTIVEDLVDGDVRVFLTHSHWDHLGAAHQFEEMVISDKERESDGTVRYDFLPGDNENRPQTFMQRWLDSGRELPDGFDAESYDIRPIPDVGTVEHGDELTVGDKQLEAVAIPGHTPGLLGVLDREAGIIHTADLLESTDEGHLEVLAHFISSDFDTYQESLDRLITLRDEGAFNMMTQTHGEPIEDLSVLDDAQQALEAVANDEMAFQTQKHPLGKQRKYQIDDIVVSVRHE